MPTYTATFYTTVGSADLVLKATSPRRALSQARASYRDRPETLHFDPYESDIEEIVIHDETETEVVRWQSDDLRLRLAADELFQALSAQTAAAQSVLDAWVTGDLAAAVRHLSATMTDAYVILAKAKGGVA